MYKNKKYSFTEIIILLVFVAFSIFIYTGFFKSDPYAVKRFGMIYFLILLGIRVGIPLLVIGIIGLYYGIKANRVSPGNIGLIIGSLIIVLLLMYPFLNYYYNAARINDKIKEYHPYLQLNPIILQGNNYSQADFNILCLGGSTTEFKDSKKRGWPDRIQELLIKNLGEKDINVHNLGRQWYTTLHTLINYQTNICKFSPDVIIVMHNINDLLHNADFSYFSHGEFRDDYGHFYGPVDLLITGRNFIKVLLNRIDFWYYKPRHIVNQTKFPGLVPFKNNLNSLIDLAEKDGTQVVLLTQPYLLKEKMTVEETDHLYMLNTEAVGPDKRWSLMSALRGMESYNETVRKVAQARGVSLIDLEKAIPKSLEYFYDEVHYQDKTFNLIAKYITEELIKQGIVKLSKLES